jgi:hypothetical protein
MMTLFFALLALTGIFGAMYKAVYIDRDQCSNGTKVTRLDDIADMRRVGGPPWSATRRGSGVASISWVPGALGVGHGD